MTGIIAIILFAVIACSMFFGGYDLSEWAFIKQWLTDSVDVLAGPNNQRRVAIARTASDIRRPQPPRGTEESEEKYRKKLGRYFAEKRKWEQLK